MISIKDEVEVVYLTPADFNSICRTCLASQIEFVNIFTKQHNEKSISQLLSSCANLEVSEQDSLPKQVCALCISELYASYNFKEKSRKSNELLLCVLADTEKTFDRSLIVKKELNESINLNNYFINFDETAEDVDLEEVKEEMWESGIKNDVRENLFPDPLIEDDQKVKRKRGRPRKYPPEKTHTENEFQMEVKIACNDCRESFPSKEQLNTHKCISYSISCKKCKERCKSIKALRLHQCEAVHLKSAYTLFKPQIIEIVKDAGDNIVEVIKPVLSLHGKLVCHICDREYKCTRSLKHHIRSHTGEKPALCSWCGKSFREERGLLNHVTAVHTKEKRFMCSFCPKAFPVSGKRRQHERVHTGEKPYECELCNRLFAARTTLSAHLRRHTGENKFRCTFEGCGKGFYAFSTYQRHTWKHTNKRPYPCEQCTKSYLSRQNLRSHVKSAHTQIRDEVCHICGKMYSEKSVLNRHLRQIHSVEPKDLERE